MRVSVSRQWAPLHLRLYWINLMLNDPIHSVLIISVGKLSFWRELLCGYSWLEIMRLRVIDGLSWLLVDITLVGVRCLVLNISDTVLSRNCEVMRTCEIWGVWKRNTLVEIKRSLRGNIYLLRNLPLLVVGRALYRLISDGWIGPGCLIFFLSRLIEWGRKKGGSIGWQVKNTSLRGWRWMRMWTIACRLWGSLRPVALGTSWVLLMRH